MASRTAQTVYLSYSRRDAAFVNRISQALRARGFEILIDRSDIASGDTFKKSLALLIRRSDAVVFVISPDSVSSSFSAWELDCAQQSGKRILPIVYRNVDNSKIPPQVSKLNFLFFPEDDAGGFERAVEALVEALRTDVDWNREHARLGEAAYRWEHGHRSSDFFLRGDALRTAERWLRSAPPGAPEPRRAIVELIAASRQAAIRRQRIFAATSFVLACCTVVLAYFAYAYREEATTVKTRAERAEAQVKLLKEAEKAALQAKKAGKPILYALIVGVADYKDKAVPELKWSNKDARDLAELLASQKGGYYDAVHIDLLVDREATRARIVDKLASLERNVTDNDVALVFLAGHGASDSRQRYYFLPHDAQLEPDVGYFLPQRSTAILQSEIKNAMSSLPARAAFFFFDTCHAGRAGGQWRGGGIEAVMKEFESSETPILVLSSSRGDELSQESDAWQNGAFTKALLEGLKGEGTKLDADGLVSSDELESYVKRRVRDLTKGQQSPVSLKPRQFPDIPLVRVRPAQP